MNLLTPLLRSSLALATAAALAGGCQQDTPGSAQTGQPGTVSGVFAFNGQPAVNRSVSLFTSRDGSNWTDTGKVARTDGTGTYLFTGLQPGMYLVQYLSDPTGATTGGTTSPGNEYVLWRTHPDSVGNQGIVFTSVDLAYGGQLSPPADATVQRPITFHWSTGATAQGYRVRLYKRGLSAAPVWVSDFVTAPAVTLTQAIPTGDYEWEVSIDGGNTGSGLSRRRTILFQGS